MCTEWGAVGTFPRLETLDLDENALTGNLWMEWQSLPRLRGLSVKDNAGLEGTLPAGLVPWVPATT